MPDGGLSDACRLKLSVLDHNTCSNEATCTLQTLNKIEGVAHSWFLHIILQSSGRPIRQKFADTKISTLFDIQALEQLFRWNNVEHVSLLKDIKEAAEILRESCTTPFDDIVRNAYEVQGQRIFLWSEKFLRRCFEVNEIFWLSCEDLFQRTKSLVCGDEIDISGMYLPKIQPNITRVPSFVSYFSRESVQKQKTAQQALMFKTTFREEMESSCSTQDEVFEFDEFE